MDRVKIRRRELEDDDNNRLFLYQSGWPYINIGFGDEKDYFIENLSLLITGGLGITASLAAIKPGIKNRRMKKLVTVIEGLVNEGIPLWKAFKETGLFPTRVLSIIKAGEESGRLPEHLSLVSIQLHKERIFTSRVRSALLYPSIVFIVAIAVAVGSAWYTLPRVTSVLSQTIGTLPWSTRVLIWLGNFIATSGYWIMPLTLAIIFLLFYFIFLFYKTKFIGEWIILKLPGINKLLQGVEVARFGFLFGAMLQAGIVITDALETVIEGTGFVLYKKFYRNIQAQLNEGHNLATAFNSYKHSDRFIPLPMQQLIIASEQSGKLSETLLKIGVIFEEKTEAQTRDLATILEPIVLIFVAIVVGFIILAIITPIYTLVQQIQ